VCSYICSTLRLLQSKRGGLRVWCYARYTHWLTILDDGDRPSVVVGGQLSASLLDCIIDTQLLCEAVEAGDVLVLDNLIIRQLVTNPMPIRMALLYGASSRAIVSTVSRISYEIGIYSEIALSRSSWLMLYACRTM
jgi:hypothetical protein